MTCAYVPKRVWSVTHRTRDLGRIHLLGQKKRRQTVAEISRRARTRHGRQVLKSKDPAVMGERVFRFELEFLQRNGWRDSCRWSRSAERRHAF
jgi:hypothetical protein